MKHSKIANQSTQEPASSVPGYSRCPKMIGTQFTEPSTTQRFTPDISSRLSGQSGVPVQNQPFAHIGQANANTVKGTRMPNLDEINQQISQVLEQVSKLASMVGIDPEEPTEPSA